MSAHCVFAGPKNYLLIFKAWTVFRSSLDETMKQRDSDESAAVMDPCSMGS